MPYNLLLVNPNASQTTTDMMVAIAQEHLEKLGRTDICLYGLTAPKGPMMLTEMEELIQAASLACHSLVLQQAMNADGVIVSAFGDPGLEELTEKITQPVIGIGQAAMQKAARSGSPFGITTTTPGLAESILNQVERYGWRKHFSGLRLTPTPPLELSHSPAQQLQELENSVRECIEKDGARAVIIGGGPLAQSAQLLQDKFAIPVINPIVAACELMAERLPKC